MYFSAGVLPAVHWNGYKKLDTYFGVCLYQCLHGLTQQKPILFKYNSTMLEIDRRGLEDTVVTKYIKEH